MKLFLSKTFIQPHKFIGVCFGAWLGLFTVACSGHDSTMKVTYQNPSNAKEVNEANTITLDCNDRNGYSFVVVENPNRKANADPVIPKDLNIVVSDKIIAKIELPKADSEVKNFSLNSVERTKEGFEVKVEWGGGLYHYEIQFDFRCKENNFYLYRVKNEDFSTTNPDSGNFWDKKETEETKIEPNLPIEKFVMNDYLH